MLKHKKFLSILLFLPLFAMFSCGKVTEPYPVHKQTGDESDHLTVDATNLPTTINNGEKLPIDKLEVKYNNAPLEWLEDSKEFKTEGKFFLVSNADYPTNSIVTNLVVTTNVEKNDLKFYVGYFNENTVYVSKQLSITVLNDNAIKPWVWYTVTGVVVFAVIGMVMFTRHYKAKKEGKI